MPCHSRRFGVACALLAAVLAQCKPAASPPAPTTLTIPSCGPANAPRQGGASPRPLVQSGHTAAITGLSFGPDGLLASASEDGSVRVWDVGDRTLLRVLRSAALRSPSAVAWDSSGDALLVTSAQSGRDPATTVAIDREGRTLARFDAGVRAVFAPPSAPARRWLVASSDGFAWLDASRCATEAQPGGADSLALEHAAISRDGRTYAAYDYRGLEVLSLSDPARSPVRRALPGYITGLAVAPRGDVALVTVDTKGGAPTADPDHLALLVPLGDATEPPRELSHALVRAHAPAISPDGALAAAVTALPGREFDHQIVVWDWATGRERWRSAPLDVSVDGPLIAFGAAPGSPEAWLVAATTTGHLVVFDAATGRAEGELGRARARAPHRLAFGSGGALAAASDTATVVWSLSSGAVQDRGPGARFVSGDGADLATAAPFDEGSMHTPKDAACPEGALPIAVEGWSGARPPTTARAPGDARWPPRAGATTAFCASHVADVLAQGAVSMDDLLQDVDFVRGRAVVNLFDASTPDGALVVRDLRSDAGVALEGARHYRGARFSDDGRIVAAVQPYRVPEGQDVVYGFEDYDVATFWDAATGKAIVRAATVGSPYEGAADAGAPPPKTKTCGTEQVRGPAPFGADGAAVSADGRQGAVWRAARVRVLSFDGSSDVTVALDGAVGACAFAGDDTLLVGGKDGALRVLRGGAVVARGEGSGGGIVEIVASHDGATAATIAEDGTVGVWDVASARLRATLADFDDDESVAFTPAGAYAGTLEVAERVGWVFPAPIEAFRFEQFARTFARPEIVRARLAGSDADVAAAPPRPPHVALRAVSSTGRAARLTLRVSSPTRVDAVRAYADALPVAARAVCAADADVSLDVPIEPGPNLLTVKAFDDQGFAANDVTTSARGEGPPSARPDIWVVAVGVQRYPNLDASMQLSFADDDARGVAAAFSALAGPGKTYAAAHVRLLVDEQVTIESVRAALSELSRASPRDVAVVFFGGHGVKPSDSEDMLFVMGDVRGAVDPTTGALVVRRADVERSGIGWSAIGDLLSAVPGRVLVMLDACHSGHITQSAIVPNAALADRLNASGRAGVVVFAAAKGRQLSYEPRGARALVLDGAALSLVRPPDAAPEQEHGFFTGAVLASLESPETDRNGDGAVELSELEDDVRSRVERATRGQQTPWIARREAFGDFRLREIRR